MRGRRSERTTVVRRPGYSQAGTEVEGPGQECFGILKLILAAKTLWGVELSLLCVKSKNGA